MIYFLNVKESKNGIKQFVTIEVISLAAFTYPTRSLPNGRWLLLFFFYFSLFFSLGSAQD